MDTSLFEVLPAPIKSESDKREYKVIKLKNGLVACLISDSNQLQQNEESQETATDLQFEKKSVEEKKAAVMLSIGVGSFSDPKEIQGMAHFLEHMVFMGSEKYPLENDFNAFITKRGGSYNAFTMDERTCFFFDCLEKHLEEALDKFAQFFICPLLKKDAMIREREAVDSEFQMVLVADCVRQQQLLLSLSQENSPTNKFTWGNLKTLKDNVDDDTLHAALDEFRKRHYSAHRMTVAIQTRIKMDIVEELIIKYFSNIPNNLMPTDDFSAFHGKVFNTTQFNKMYYFKPIDECIDININWPLPPLMEKYKTKSLKYLEYILCFEGKGSLLAYFKRHMWATIAYATAVENSMCSLFIYYIQLTEEGFKHIFDIIKAVFSYINLIKKVGPQKRIYDEVKLISETAFRFAKEEPSVYTVLELEEPMHIFPSEHYLTGSKLYYEFDPEEIKMIVDHLTPSNVNFLISNKILPDGLKFNKTEKWFGTEYLDTDISDNLRIEWESAVPLPEFEIPAPNLYLSTDFTIFPEQSETPEFPQKLMDTEKCELWYRQDNKFKLPLAHYCFYFISPVFINSPKNSALADLFTNLVTFSLDEEACPATLANLKYYIGFYDKGIYITVEGYNEKIYILIDLIIKHITNIREYITEKIFLGLKENAIKNTFNATRSPSYLSDESRQKLLVSPYWTSREKYNELLKLTYVDMEQFIEYYGKEFYVKALAQGNILPDDAINTVNNLMDALNFDSLPQEKYPMFVVAEVPIGEKCLLIESFNRVDSNSTTENFYQVGQFTFRDSVIIDLIMLIMGAHAFDILRTQEQLGYSVYCSPSEMEGILGYSITVMTQAHKYTTEYLDTRIDEFIKHSQEILEDVTEADLQQFKKDYIKTKKCVDVQLSEEVSRNWNEIMKDEYIFDRPKQEIETAKGITLDEVKKWWYKHNHFGGHENYRKISLQVAGHIQDHGDDNISNGESGDKKEIIDLSYGKPISIKYLGYNKENERSNNPDYFIENINGFREKLPKYLPKCLKKIL